MKIFGLRIGGPKRTASHRRGFMASGPTYRRPRKYGGSGRPANTRDQLRQRSSYGQSLSPRWYERGAPGARALRSMWK